MEPDGTSHPECNGECLSCDACDDVIGLKWIRARDPAPDDPTQTIDVCLACRAELRVVTDDGFCEHMDYWVPLQTHCLACETAWTSNDEAIWWRRDEACPCSNHDYDAADDV
jgi:hypothetical protein